MKNKAYSYIRFSTPEQKKGDSLRRQIKGAEDWTKKHGIELDNTLKPDEGFSAFNGHHRTKGALGEFLRLVESSKIPKGSILIVESLDRLSREQVLDALGQFTQIISRGIKVVTLSDGMEYTEEGINANFGQLLMSIVIMSRAHEESATKSKRLKEAWKKKREDIQEKKLTSRCPAWLKLSENGKKFDPIDIRCQTIEKIFRMKLSDNKGAYTIERELNGMQGIWKPESGWRTSYIKKILRNPAVIGEYQPHKMVEGKRQPVGELIKDYFPCIVDLDLYYAVQAQMKKNRGKYHGGRTGKLNNLFSHKAVCGYCGSPMHFVDKGKPPKGGKYLVCESAKRGNGCKYHAYRYEDFEEKVLEYCAEKLEVKDLLKTNRDTEDEISEIEIKLSSIQGQLNKVESEIVNLTDSIASTSDRRIRELLESKLTGRLDEEEHLEKSIQEKEWELKSKTDIRENAQERIENVKQLTEHMRKLKDEGEMDTLIDVRFRLREALRKLIENIKVYPVGYGTFVEKKTAIETIEQAIKKATKEAKNDPHLTNDMIEYVKDECYSRIENRYYRFFEIYFEGGAAKRVCPNSSPELTLDTDSGIHILEDDTGHLVRHHGSNPLWYLNL